MLHYNNDPAKGAVGYYSHNGFLGPKKLKAIWTEKPEQNLQTIYSLMFDTHANATDYLMTVNNLSVGLNTPTALQSKAADGTEFTVQVLPPYRPRKAFLVDEYPACPENWMRSTGRIKSYFVAVKENCGLWLDFNQCWNSPSHVGIVISVQGINAITGLPCKDAQLEQYRDECPRHKEVFGPDRLCQKCGFKWPKQNYLASSSTPHGRLWIDGFRAEDGQVRQYVFTAQEMRGVAAAIIGKDRVFALGISFFLAKQPKPPQTSSFQSRGWHATNETLIGSDSDYLSLIEKSSNYCCDSVASASMSLNDSFPTGSLGTKGPANRKMSKLREVDASYLERVKLCAASPVRSVTVKQLEVAAGARINQTVADDTCDLDYYQKEPDGLVVINYCTEEDAKKIIAAGKTDVKGNPEGFLQNVPVGNP